MDRSPEHTAMYAEGLKQVAQKLQVPVVDIYTSMMDYASCADPQWTGTSGPCPSPSGSVNMDKLGQLFTDGLHYSALGNRILYAKAS